MKKKWILPIITLGFTQIYTTGCKEEETLLTPTITTSPVIYITQTSAASGGIITSEGSDAVIARGVCWSKSSSPTINDNITSDGVGTGSFTSELIDLFVNTKYYVRAYATNSVGTAYGETISFFTFDPDHPVDADGNIYNIVKIGNQNWMIENLKTTKYNDGTPLKKITDNEDWSSFTTGAYCWYNNDSTNYINEYGALYNFYTIINNRKLCPSGWHVPSDQEWITLIYFLGGLDVAGGKMKSTTLWENPNTGANNSSGFSAFPGGYRYNENGNYYAIGQSGYWWSKTEYSTILAWTIGLTYDHVSINHNFYNKNFGFSVRCIRD